MQSDIFPIILQLFFSALGSGVAISITVFFGRAFLKLQTDKILAHYTQVLSIEKAKLSHELAVEFHQKSIAITRIEQDRTNALKLLYDIIIELNFALIKIRPFATINRAQGFAHGYFTSLSGMFTAVSATFTYISESHKTLERNAIYIDPDTEARISEMLMTIQKYYDDVLFKLNEILAKAQAVDSSHLEVSCPKDLSILASEISSGWNQIIEPNKQMLKCDIRKSLMKVNTTSAYNTEGSDMPV